MFLSQIIPTISLAVWYAGSLCPMSRRVPGLRIKLVPEYISPSEHGQLNHSFILISCHHRYTVLLCVDLQRIADSILYADILVRESMTVLFTNPRQNMWHSQAMQPAQHTRSVRMVFGCGAFSQCIIPWPEFPGMHAIIERVCLGIPKRCIVGNSLTCPSGLWACQRVSHNVLMA